MLNRESGEDAEAGKASNPLCAGDAALFQSGNAGRGFNEALLFSVQDTGRGIAPADLGRIFDAFERAIEPGPGHEGTGLGLAISRGFVRLLGGEMTVRSQPGAGSVFSFTLPFAEASQGETGGRMPEAADGSLAPGQGEWRILVVDDRHSNRQLLGALLVSAGFQVREAADGQEAITVFQAWKPHLIFMDLRMPGMDGSEAVQRIRTLPGGGQTVIIAATASAFQEQRQEAFEARMNDFIVKPFRLSEVLEKIRTHLGVVYVHREPAADGGAAQAPPPVALMAADWAGLPPGRREELRQASLSGDIFRLRELVEGLAPEHPRLAQILRSWTDGFELEKLAELLQ